MTREQKIYVTTLVGSAGNIALLAFKCVAGIVGNSSAMIADAIHSLSDFIADVTVLLFVRISSKPRDKSHEYGYGKYETVASFLIGLAIAIVAIGIFVEGVEKIVSILKGSPVEAPEMIALWAVGLSIIVKELLYRYTAWKGRKLDSSALAANAWHHRSDALSSIGTLIGISGAIVLGGKWIILDPIASLVVAVMLMVVSYRMLRDRLNELTDGALSPETENEILHIVGSFPGVDSTSNLRTRSLGAAIAIECNVQMEGSMTLLETDAVVSGIENSLKERFGENTHVNIHMEPLQR